MHPIIFVNQAFIKLTGYAKKEVVRAAFYALTESHGDASEHLRDLHGFAITATCR